MGVEVPIASTIVFHEALGKIGIHERDNVYWAGRTTLLSQPEDIPIYDEAFQSFWEGSIRVEILKPNEVNNFGSLPDSEIDLDEIEDGINHDNIVSLKYSRSEILSEKDFALYSEEELDEVYNLMKSIELIGGKRQSRRRIATSKQTKHPDLKKIVKSSFRTGGEPIKRHFTHRGEKTRQIIFLLDIGYGRWTNCSFRCSRYAPFLFGLGVRALTSLFIVSNMGRKEKTICCYKIHNLYRRKFLVYSFSLFSDGFLWRWNSKL